MYIAEVCIHNFRGFTHFSLEFNEGMNVIIGHNNAGKTNLLKALSLVFNRQMVKRLEIDDFNKNQTDFSTPPSVRVEVLIRESSNPANERQDDLAIVSTWLTRVESPYEARITYEYFLPEAYLKDYQDSLAEVRLSSHSKTSDYWRNIETHFLRKYVARIYAGNHELRNRVEPEYLEKFDVQFLDAIRDVEKQLFSGGNATLKEILTYFLDDNINQDITLSKEEKRQKKTQLKNAFQKNASQLIHDLSLRVDTQAILKYATDTGASVGGIPSFEGEIGEAELLSALKLFISNQLGLRLPATHNGLGYNNLVFMALLLAKMQMDSSSYSGEENAKVFPMLLIEEPEAHLHPSLQYKFLKFLKQNITQQRQVRQVFITTHSTHITAAVSLDELICLHVNELGIQRASYPGKVFHPLRDAESKSYVERFLDATKSDLLFSKRVILVEGVAEQMLMQCFAHYEGKVLEDTHTAVINIGGSTFKHFIKLFDYHPDDAHKKYAIDKLVACVMDVDPTQKIGSSWNGCYPFEVDSSSQDFNSVSAVIENLRSELSSNIALCYNDTGKGKTLEYDLAYHNPSSELLITSGMVTKHQTLFRQILQTQTHNDFATIASYSGVDSTIAEKIRRSGWEEEDKKKALIASHYLKFVEKLKGDHAMGLERHLSKNLMLAEPLPFILPDYIKRAIYWTT